MWKNCRGLEGLRGFCHWGIGGFPATVTIRQPLLQPLNTIWVEIPQLLDGCSGNERWHSRIMLQSVVGRISFGLGVQRDRPGAFRAQGTHQSTFVRQMVRDPEIGVTDGGTAPYFPHDSRCDLQYSFVVSSHSNQCGMAIGIHHI